MPNRNVNPPSTVTTKAARPANPHGPSPIAKPEPYSSVPTDGDPGHGA